MRAPLLSFGLGAAVAALSGCATPVGPSGEAADAEVSANATAIVVVEGTTGADGAHTSAIARFVKARGGAVDDDALRMAGAAVDFPALGSCGPLAANRVTQARPIALLDVGGVTLVNGDVTTPLAPRLLPDVADLVSGVVYSARADAMPARGAYGLRVDGSPDLDVAPFAVTATSPGEPTDLRVAGDDGRRGPVAIAPGAPVAITWDAEATDDVAYVDVLDADGAAQSRCLFAYAGRAALPASAFGAIDDGALAVHRVHREAFKARGVDPGEVRFDFARVVPFTRR